VQCLVCGRWRVLAELVDGPAGCGKLPEMGVYLLGTSVWQGQLSSRRQRERRSGPNMTLSLGYWLAPRLSFEISTGQKTCTAIYQAVGCRFGSSLPLHNLYILIDTERLYWITSGLGSVPMVIYFQWDIQSSLHPYTTRIFLIPLNAKTTSIILSHAPF
jgi:hypothetical protein